MPDKTNYGSIFIIFAVLLFVQALLTYRQNIAITKEFSDIKKTNTGYLGSGIQKARFNLGKGVILVLVVGFDDLIKDFRLLEGISVMARFKKQSDYFGLTINQAREKLSTQSKRVVSAFEMAVDNINKEKEKRDDQ
ncbi:MAG TPA: hypothetical protein GX703_01300 [Erysipelothrix sp.]|nr:hypothetical protein [Erysipelothrix sp.]